MKIVNVSIAFNYYGSQVSNDGVRKKDYFFATHVRASLETPSINVLLYASL